MHSIGHQRASSVVYPECNKRIHADKWTNDPNIEEYNASMRVYFTRAIRNLHAV